MSPVQVSDYIYCTGSLVIFPWRGRGKHSVTGCNEEVNARCAPILRLAAARIMIKHRLILTLTAMYQNSHYDAALLAVAPIGAVLIAAGLFKLAVAAGVMAIAFAMVPRGQRTGSPGVIRLCPPIPGVRTIFATRNQLPFSLSSVQLARSPSVRALSSEGNWRPSTACRFPVYGVDSRAQLGCPSSTDSN